MFKSKSLPNFETSNQKRNKIKQLDRNKSFYDLRNIIVAWILTAF